ncbi:hypothetical protein P4S81_11625 [Pseudoalteromonas sp. B28]|jgi:hypothetical protein|uniref:hypothetical protein n=1 Tax=unclassified Pseudoalteromonas TaxID=194690 RepID=UPI0015F7CC3E|nr:MULTISPECIES: hypothetical protein [unclassified Pseudoalteromonas]MBB1297107.1 hypothetical protein [Pseudoalteromonas sp. SR41-7]MBB1304424.1 hypothetical protein [Pseudoalteromonas sp. SR43-5]MBB1324232.1 hypothetical protein [Pseudoalteromonas sp. SR45-1]MBB1344589.1 hypothetical protein [Pseudoalteromonas sp. SG45-2]MBB1350556.1 hypothetical protein [Pseudoalteromonas sp. SG45-3]
MFKFRVFLTAFLLLAALFSVQSNAMGASQNLNITVSTQVSLTDIADLTKIQPISKSVDTAQHKKTHQTDFDAHQPRLTANNSSLFLHTVQSEPEYDVVFEFFAQNLVRHIFLRPRAINPIQPWYTLVTNSKKSRLSGWKDVNLLYRAVTTYHA